MIRVLMAHTLEVDDVEAAVGEVLEQLDCQNKLLKNSAGLLFCYLDFINSGVVKELAARLPFPVAGCTSQNFIVSGAADEIMLAMMVLTSDDTEFSTGVSDPLDTDEEKRLEELYRRAASARSAKPSLIFAFPPLIGNLPGTPIVSTLDRVSNGTPVFGTIAIDVTDGVRSPMTIYNGEASANRLPLVLVYGSIAPRFFACSLPGNTQNNYAATITRAEGHRLISLDTMPAAAFMEKIGIIQNGALNMLFAFPLVVDSHNGTEPEPFVIYEINRDGSLMCGKDIPTGGILKIGSVTGDLILETAVRITKQALQEPGESGILLFSCISRNIVLSDPEEEVRAVREKMKDSPLPYLFMYSGGEICPLPNARGELINSFHQYTFIGCKF